MMILVSPANNAPPDPLAVLETKTLDVQVDCDTPKTPIAPPRLLPIFALIIKQLLTHEIQRV